MLRELRTRLGKIEESKFMIDHLNKECSIYLYENKDKGYKNEDVFGLIRFSITGNPVGAPVGDILEIIGKEQTMQRLDNAIEFFSS